MNIPSAIKKVMNSKVKIINHNGQLSQRKLTIYLFYKGGKLNTLIIVNSIFCSNKKDDE